MLRVLAFPIFLLFFMIPLPDFVLRQLTLPLQLLSSRLATDILHATGVAAVQQGNVIDLGVRQLQVVAACSGLRYILSLGALGIIFCYFYQRRTWKVAILLIAILPGAIIANALRVSAMAVFPVIQEGFWHDFSGWLIFIFCFGSLAILNIILNYVRPPVLVSSGMTATGTEVTTSLGKRTSYTPFLVAALILVIIAGPITLKIADVPPLPLRQSLDKFPMQIGSWQGHHVYLDPAMVKVTECDAYLNADYLDPRQDTISLWITYYESQKRGGSVHSPFSCFRGSGWLVLDDNTVEVAPGKPVRYLLVDQTGSRLLICYWFIQGGRWVTNEYLNKFIIGFHSLVHRRADGTLVRLVTPVRTNEKSAQERLDSFAKSLIPILPQFIEP